jgi:lipopolysaccharide export LptBFGC system permease protein LptF
VAILTGLLQIALDGEAVPRTLQRLYDWKVGEYERVLSNETADGSFWMRSGTDIVRLPQLTYDVEALDNLIVFQRSLSGRLVARIDAGGIHNEDGRWILTDVVRRTVKGPRVEQLERMEWQTSLPLEDLRTMAAHPSELTIGQLLRLVRNDNFGLFPPHLYQVWLHQKFAAGLAPMLLIFLCIILAQRFERGGGIGLLFLKGLLFGFAFFILARWSQALGEASYLPPLIAAWAPVIILAVVVGSFGFHHEAVMAPGVSAAEDGQENAGPEEPVLGVIKGERRETSDD